MYCPMKFGGNREDQRECEKEKCAWWTKFEPHPGGACCVTLEQVVQGQGVI